MYSIGKWLCLAVSAGGVATAAAGPLSWQNEPEGSGVPLSIRYQLSEEAVEAPRVVVPKLPSLSYPELPPTPDFSNAPAAEPLAAKDTAQPDPQADQTKTAKPTKKADKKTKIEEPEPQAVKKPESQEGHWEIERRVKAYTPGRYSLASPKRIWVGEGEPPVILSVPAQPESAFVEGEVILPPLSEMVPPQAPITPQTHCSDCETDSAPIRPVADYPIPDPPITGRLPGPIKARVNYGLARPVW